MTSRPFHESLHQPRKHIDIGDQSIDITYI